MTGQQAMGRGYGETSGRNILLLVGFTYFGHIIIHMYFFVGFTYSGQHACPMCGPRLDARYSKPLRKIVYEGA